MSYITGKLRHLPGFNWCGIPGYYTTRETGNSFSSLSDDLGKLTFDALATVEVRTTNDVFTSLQTKSEAVEQQTMLGGTKPRKTRQRETPWTRIQRANNRTRKTRQYIQNRKETRNPDHQKTRRPQTYSTDTNPKWISCQNRSKLTL